ncbi:MAG TPA: GTP 3',8-cyclase MoaA [Planctomycetaceae bacterium]|nr:GTP 3',8-cyclase MoaA [Planctomycetaceae bacterium]
MLTDKFGRVHKSLRVSVTDVCNIRCQYCMPAEDVRFLPRSRLLSYEQIARFVEVVSQWGIRRVRITGGEPLTRPGLEELVRRLRRIDAIDDIALTTNGMLLGDQIDALESAGLDRVNVSLDTLSEATFKRLSRRDGIAQVIDGIDRAVDSSLQVKLNALVLRDVNSNDVIDLVRFAAERDIPMRFIEFMPLDADGAWNDTRMVSGAELRTQIEAEFGPLTPVERATKSQPAQEYRLPTGTHVGFIDSVSTPFCGSCDRLRLTAEGKIRNCLFGTEEWDVSDLLNDKAGVDNSRVKAVVQACLAAKHAAHGIADPDFKPPQRAMYQIGG